MSMCCLKEGICLSIIMIILYAIFRSQNVKTKVQFYLKLFIFFFGITVFSPAPILRALWYRTRTTEHVKPLAWLMRYINTRLLGLHHELRGKHILDQKGPFVVTMNHQSALDLQALAWIDYFEGVCIVMKKSLLFAGPFGLCLYAMGSIFIDRKSTSDCKGKLTNTEIYMKNNAAKIYFFPEGTRNLGEEMLPFKKGAFILAIRTQAPIVPVVCSSYTSFYNVRQGTFNSGKAVVSVLPPISTVGLTEDDARDLADKVRGIMMKEYVKLNEEIKTKSYFSQSLILLCITGTWCLKHCCITYLLLCLVLCVP